MNIAIYETYPHKKNKSTLTFIEEIFSVIGLLFFTEAITSIFVSLPQIVTIIRYGITFFSIVFLLLRWRLTLLAIKSGALIWPLIGFSVLSITWSSFPSVAIESIRAEVILFTTFSLYFSSRFKPKQQLNLLAITLAIALILSLFYVLFIPSIGIHSDSDFSGAWRGIYGHKNGFSAMMALTLVVFFVLGVKNNNRFEVIISRFFIAISVLMIILSTSKTGLLVFISILLILYTYLNFRWRGKTSIFIADIFILIFFSIGSFVIVNWDFLLSSLGKSPTLSSRTLIWNGFFSENFNGINMWIGFGRESFWLPDNPLIQGYPGIENYIPAHGHNGFIDIIVDLGIVGLCLFIVGFISTFILSLKRSYSAQRPEELWPVALMFLLVIYNITESWLMRRANIYWELYLINFISLRIWVKESDGFSRRAIKYFKC